jgi:hypothetical protein
MDDLPNEIILAVEKFLNIPDSINLGKTSSRLHTLTRYSRKKIIASRNDVLHSIKQINYSVEKRPNRLYVNDDTVSIRMWSDRVTVARFIRSNYNVNPKYSGSYLRITSNACCMQEGVSRHIVANFYSQGKIFYGPTSWYEYATSTVVFAINPDEEILFQAKSHDYLIHSKQVPTEYRIIDIFPKALFDGYTFNVSIPYTRYLI